MKKNVLKNEKGITLLALIVTIIVLVILAGVTINTLSGNDRIIKNAKNVVEKYVVSTNDEKKQFEEFEDQITEIKDGATIEKVTDINPGQLEIDESDEYTYYINSIEDLVFFAYDVRENGNTYEGKKVKLNADLDFALNKSYIDSEREDYAQYGYNGKLKNKIIEDGFISIGSYNTNDSEHCFNGEFDGMNHKIYNLYINKKIENGEDYQSYGFFSSIHGGIIKNLCVNGKINMDIYDNNILIGMITGFVNEPGKIENCYADGKISVIGHNQEKYIAIGGIAGQSNYNSSIDLCENAVNIKVQNHKRVYIGGIIGSINGNGNIKRSYNKGEIKQENGAELCLVGGIVGIFGGNMEKCFNIGKLYGEQFVGAIAGYARENSTILDSQYINDNINPVGYKRENVTIKTRQNSELTIEEIKKYI